MMRSPTNPAAAARRRTTLLAVAASVSMAIVPSYARSQTPTPAQQRESWKHLSFLAQNWNTPRHPAWTATPSADSPNAAARYIWLLKSADPVKTAAEFRNAVESVSLAASMPMVSAG